ncbi:hypothetical protein [Streptomyces sp. NPDC003480]
MRTTDVRTQRVGSSLLITIDRPKARNSVNAAVARGLAAALDELHGDPAVRVGVRAVWLPAGVVLAAAAGATERRRAQPGRPQSATDVPVVAESQYEWAAADFIGTAPVDVSPNSPRQHGGYEIEGSC